MADTDNTPTTDTAPAAPPAADSTTGDFGEPTTYTRPEHLQPAGANPFDNGTAEPAPPLGQPNGVPLEEVLAVTPPEVYERPSGPTDVVTAKADPEARRQQDIANYAAEREAEARLEEAATLASPRTLTDSASPAPPPAAVPSSPSAVPGSVSSGETPADDDGEPS